MTPWRRMCVGLLLLAMTSAAAAPAAPPPRRVLVLQSFGRNFEPHDHFSALFQTELASTSPDPVEFQEISVMTALGGGEASEARFMDYLRSLNLERRFELVVAVGAPATRFVQRHRAGVFGDAPLLIGGTDRRHLVEASLSTRDAVVPIDVDLAAAFANILAVLPDTERIEVVIGNSELERFWLEEIRRAARNLDDRVEVNYLNDLPFERILERIASLPPRTAILHTLTTTDVRGVPLGGTDVIGTLRAVGRAPVFGIFDFQLGDGIVGGPLVALEDVARESARVASRILEGDAPSNHRYVPLGPGTPVFDARELAHWRIDRSRLPAGSVILHRQPTLWEAHKWRVAGIVALCVGQAILIGGLLVSRLRWRAADREVRELSGRLVTAQEAERGRLARELHDDVTQRLARLAIDVGQAEHALAESPEGDRLRKVRDGLARLSEDVHALAYRLHPSLLDDLGLTEALQVECEKFSEQAGIVAELEVRDLSPAIPREIALGLFRVVQESLRNVERHARARRVDVAMQGYDGGVRLAVRDDGVGVDPALTRGRSGLGLASMRERVSMLGGTFEFDSRPGGGTTVRAFVPLDGGRT